MLIYWAMFVVLAAGTLLSNWQSHGPRWSLVLLATVPTALMIGLRWDIGPDWDDYADIFRYTGIYSLWQSVTHEDPGFFLVQWGLHQFDAPFWAENLVCGIVFTAGLTAFCARQRNPFLAYLLAFPYLVIVIGMSGNRQSLALGFLFFALNAFERQHVLRFVLLTFVAAMFHASAILMLPIGLFSFTRNGPLRALLLLIAAITAYSVLRGAFGTYANRYRVENIQSSGVWFRVAMNALPAALFLRYQRMFQLEEHERVLWRNISICSLLLIALVFVIPSSTAVDRLILYFFPLQFVVLSRMPYVLSADQKALRLNTCALVIYAALIQFVFLGFGKFASYYVPYNSIFSGTGRVIS